MMKTKVLVYIICATAIGSLTQAVWAQQRKLSFSTEGWWKPAEPPFSPVVNDDNSITFRVKAPDAQRVILHFDEWDILSKPMVKDAQGVWTITIEPVIPRLYQYLFEIDGIRTIDFANPVVKAGTSVYGSVVEVHGSPSAL